MTNDDNEPSGMVQSEQDISSQGSSVSAMLSGRDGLVLEEYILPKFLPLQRWFAAKDRTIEKTRIALLAEIGEGQALAAVDVAFDGGSQRYLLPLTLVWDRPEEPEGSSHKLATLRREGATGALIDGASDPDFAALLMRHLRDGATLDSADGTMLFRGSDALASLGELGAPRLLGADQSNVSIVFGDKAVLKIYRLLRTGPQPDVDMAKVLTGAAGFANTPALLGSIEHRSPGGEATTLAAAFAFVPNRGDAWQAIVTALRQEPASAGAEEKFSFPLDIGDLLGRRTAEMHRALAFPTDDPAFAVHATKQADVEAWARAVGSDVEEMLANLERADLSGSAADAADEVLFIKDALFAQIGAVSSMTPSGGQSRIHGDYHLGQVLVTDDDVMIIDFEGEPRRSLEERRAKSSPLRDVAGMLRSFDYAAASAVAEGQIAGFDASRAVRWRDTTSARFLSAYAETMGGCPTYPGDVAFANALLDLFLIQKAAYEISYELANRPAWVSIPLRGLIGLVGESRPSPDIL